MNKFVKVILILSGCLFGFGVVFTLAAFVMGATVKDMDYSNRFGTGKFRSDVFHINIGKDDDSLMPELDIGFNTGSDEVTVSGELDQMSSFENVSNINLEVGASTVEIAYADVDKVQVHYDDAVGMNMEIDERELDVECRASGTVEILIPIGGQVDSIDLEIGAGKVVISDVFFKKLDAEIGAGELSVYAPNAQEAYDYSVECAIGTVCIGDETFTGITSTDKNLGGDYYMDIDCGAGRVEIQFAE